MFVYCQEEVVIIKNNLGVGEGYIILIQYYVNQI